jgi:hypothetical protein
VRYSKKNAETVDELITAEFASVVLSVLLIYIRKFGWSIIPNLLDEGVGV